MPKMSLVTPSRRYVRDDNYSNQMDLEDLNELVELSEFLEQQMMELLVLVYYQLLQQL